MQPAVKMALVGVLSRPTPWATFKTRELRGLKSSEKPAPQAEASPQQAESLAAGARPFEDYHYRNLSFS